MSVLNIISDKRKNVAQLFKFGIISNKMLCFHTFIATKYCLLF